MLKNITTNLILLVTLLLLSSSNTNNCIRTKVIAEHIVHLWELIGDAQAYPSPGSSFYNNSYTSHAGVSLSGICIGCVIDDEKSYSMVRCSSGEMDVYWNYSLGMGLEIGTWQVNVPITSEVISITYSGVSECCENAPL